MEKIPKVLLIDDEPDFVDATKIVLGSKPYEVIVAYDGIEGLEKARREKPDVIILDVMMPEPDGYEVCNELKSDPQLEHIPVLLLTAVMKKIVHTRWTREMGMRTEANDYIDKPVEPDELLRRVEKLLQKTS